MVCNQRHLADRPRPPHALSRRRFVALGLAVAATPLLLGWTRSRELRFGADPQTMEAGDYTWAPERGPDGPVTMIVSLPEQRVYVYRSGVLVAVSTCSTGRKGHRTPTGVFSILQKDKDHVSSTYKGAKMPFMERLTWSGIALHAGNLPGYPASHGCIRMPYDFAEALFGITRLGMVVIIAAAHSEPMDVVHPGLFLPAAAQEEVLTVPAKAQQKTLPPHRRHEAPTRPAKVIVSVADRSMLLLEDGHVRARGTITISDPEKPVGNHTFVLKTAPEGSEALVWTAVAYAGEVGAAPAVDAGVLDRLSTDPDTAHALHSLMHPGLVMVITDDRASEDTRSGRSFVVATHHPPADWRGEVFHHD